MAPGHPIPSLRIFVVHPSSEGHTIFGNKDRAMSEIFTIIIAKEAHAVRQNAPIPPFAGNAVHKPTPQRCVFKFVIPPDGMSEHVRSERVVIIDSDVVKGRGSIGRIEMLDQSAEKFRNERFVTEPITYLL